MNDQQAFSSQVVARYWERVKKSDSCWNWAGAVTKDGYGLLWSNGTLVYAHRAALVLAGGSLEAGMVVDHKCRNRSCVNPEHIRQVSRRTNAVENNIGALAKHAQKTACKWGHSFTSENTKWQQKPGRAHKTRVCLACYENKKRRQRAKPLAEDAEHEKASQK